MFETNGLLGPWPPVSASLVCPRGLAALAAIWLAPLAVRAQDASALARSFAIERLSVMTGADTAAYRRLLASAVDSCIGTDSIGYLAWVLRPLPFGQPGGTVESVSLAQLRRGAGRDTLVTFPVAPTHAIDISYVRASGQGASVRALVAPSKTGWVEVIGCPTAAGWQEFGRRRRERDARRAAAIAALDSLPRTAVESALMLRDQGQAIEATRALMVRGLTIRRARDVLDLLAETANRR